VVLLGRAAGGGDKATAIVPSSLCFHCLACQPSSALGILRSTFFLSPWPFAILSFPLSHPSSLPLPFFIVFFSVVNTSSLCFRCVIAIPASLFSSLPLSHLCLSYLCSAYLSIIFAILFSYLPGISSYSLCFPHYSLARVTGSKINLCGGHTR